jgi:hypothetical protein
VVERSQPWTCPGDDGVYVREPVQGFDGSGSHGAPAELDAGCEPYGSNSSDSLALSEFADSCSGQTRDATVAERRRERGQLTVGRSEHEDDEVGVAQGLGPCHDGAIFWGARYAQTG